jgi:Sortase domain
MPASPDSRENELDIRACRPGRVGGVPHPGCDLDAPRSRALRALQVVEQRAGASDQSLWSPERVSAWRKAVSEPSPAPLAVLRIPKLRLEVPVLPGTDDRALDRAVGHIEDTARPGTDGNSGIAGHRDGF